MANAGLIFTDDQIDRNDNYDTDVQQNVFGNIIGKNTVLIFRNFERDLNLIFQAYPISCGG